MSKRTRFGALAPACWQKTLEDEDAQQRLEANPFRTAVLALERAHTEDE